MSHLFSSALQSFLSKADLTGWTNLEFFTNGTAERIAEILNEHSCAGKAILPPAENIYNALVRTPKEKTKVVILGQDPYPTPGDAHGLAFSYVGSRRLPASLKVILKEMAADIGGTVPTVGDLSSWADQGVLLLNTALTVESGKAGAHLKLGWQQLTEEIVKTLSNEKTPIVFMLWGSSARKYAEQIDPSKHLILEAGHPSPLNRLRDFEGSRPFSKANEWLAEKGRGVIDWRL